MLYIASSPFLEGALAGSWKRRLQMAGMVFHHHPLASSSSSSSSAAAAPRASPSLSSIAPMDPVFEQKRALRSRLRRLLRHNFPPHLRHAQDAAIQSHILEAPWYKNSSRVCAYISCEALREVDTSKIIADLLQRGQSDSAKKLYVPWVEDKASHMRLLHITSIQDLQANSMEILEPTPTDAAGNPREDVMQANEPVDLMLLPGLAFDPAGRRLGRGGGYYDLFLKNYLLRAEDRGWKPPLLVALAYSVQILNESVPADATDMPIDAIVSSSGVLPISTLALDQMAFKNDAN